MDPKSLNNLDPKLRDAYERVMSTSVPPGQPVANQEPPVPQQPVAPTSELSSPMPSQPHSVIPEPAQQNNLSSQPLSQPFGMPNQEESNTFAAAATQSFTPAYTAADSQALQKANADAFAQASTAKIPVGNYSQKGTDTQAEGTSSLARIVYVLAAILFLVLYTFVWIKIFNFQLSF